MQLLSRHNERFEVPKPEQDLISKYYRPPHGDEKGVFVSSTEILQKIGGGMTYLLTSNRLGRAMTALGFVGMRSHSRRGYNVVEYSDKERMMNQSMLAYDACPESEAVAVTASEIFDTNDTIF